MSLTGITLSDLHTYGMGRVLLSVKFAIGATGAVGAIDGKGFAATAALPYKGSVVRDDVGTYTITLPGRGAVQDIIPVGEPVLIVNGNNLWVRIDAIDLDARTITLQCVGRDSTFDDTEAASGDSLCLTVLVKNVKIDD